MSLKNLARLGAALALVWSMTATAVVPTEGKEYKKVPNPQATQTGKNIEVLEIFWYGCSHCYHLESSLQAWKKALPSDVTFRTTPAAWNMMMVQHAKVFFATEQMGLLPKLHDSIFDALHKEGANLHQEDDVLAWMGKHGVDTAKFKTYYNSFSVSNLANRAQSTASQYGAEGVPVLVINGKWLTAPSMAGGEQQALQVADYLIAKERELNKPAAAPAGKTPAAKPATKKTSAKNSHKKAA